MSKKSSKSTQASIIHHKWKNINNKKEKTTKSRERGRHVQRRRIRDGILATTGWKTSAESKRGSAGNGGCTYWGRSWLRIYEPMYTNEVISGYLTFHLSSYVELRVTRPQEWMRPCWNSASDRATRPSIASKQKTKPGLRTWLRLTRSWSCDGF